jgi:hypothetical protein
MEVTIKLTVDEVNVILELLGETPTKLGLYPLALSIKNQAESQLPAQTETPAE